MELNERWMRLACVVAGADHDLLRDANAIDRMTVGGNATVLMLVGTLAVTAWSAFFASFLLRTYAWKTWPLIQARHRSRRG